MKQIAPQLKTAFLHIEQFLESLNANKKLTTALWNVKENLVTIKQNVQESTAHIFQLEELTKIALRLASSLDIDPTLNTVIDTILHLTGMTRAYLILCDELDGQLTPRVARNWKAEDLPQEEVVFSQTVIQSVISNKTRVVSLQAQKEIKTSSVYNLGIDTVMCIPLLVQNNLIGVIYADSCNRDQIIISPANVTLIEAFAAQAAFAIRNAQLYKDLKSARQQIVLARDKERRQLGRNLHDVVSGRLAGINYSLLAAQSHLEQGNMSKIANLLTNIRHDLEITQKNSRRIAHDLYPVELDELGLIGALQDRALSYLHLFAVTWVIPSRFPVLPAAVELVIHHIVSEALANIARHAHAERCIIEIVIDEHRVIVKISDNGQGISDKSQPGVGLSSISERANEIGGKCEIASDATSGTTLHITLPLKDFDV